MGAFTAEQDSSGILKYRHNKEPDGTVLAII